MSKLERLLKLLAVLLDTPYPLAAEDLRHKIGGYPDSDPSFRRAFERDKDDLRSMGVMLRVEPVPGTDPPLDGYRIDADEYAGRDPGLEPDELAALHLAAALVRLDSVGEDAFWKLGGVEPTAAPSTPALATLPTSAEAAALYTAVTERRVASFDYRGERRSLEPSRMSFQRGHWYVSGIDRLRDAERIFRLDRISGGIDLGEPDAFEPVDARSPETTRPWEIGDGASIPARVLIDAGEAMWARVHLSEDEIVEHRDDGSVIVAVDVRNVDAFRDWVLGFLDNAEVLDPPELRADLLQWLVAIENAHGEPAARGAGA